MSVQVNPVDEKSQALSGLGEAGRPVDNFLRVMANKPAIAHAFRPLHESIMQGGALEKRVKTLVYLAVSYVNECPYDVAYAHALAVDEGFSDDEIRAVRMEQDHNFTTIEHAALKMARDLTRTCTADDMESNEEDLFSGEQMVELAAVISLANFNNRFSNALDIEHPKTH